MQKKLILKSFDKIFVINKTNKINIDIEEPPLSYVGDASNNENIYTGLSWAGLSYNDNLDKIKYFDNNGFKLQIMSCPDNSSRGGKLSFWICKITTKDNYSFLTSINSLLLEYLLKECDFVKGVCQEEVIFVRNKSQLGVISKNGELFQQLLSHEYMRKNPKNKTNEYKPGDIVENLKEKYVYLGYLYNYFKFSYNRDFSNKIINYTILIYKKPRKNHLYLTKSWSGKIYCPQISLFEWMYKQEKEKYFITGNKQIKNIEEYIKDEFCIPYYDSFSEDNFETAYDFYKFINRENENETIDIEQLKRYIEKYHKLHNNFYKFNIHIIYEK